MLRKGRKGAYYNYGKDDVESSELIFVNLEKLAEKRGRPQMLLLAKL